MVQQYKYENMFRKDFSLRMKNEIKQSMDVALEAYTQFMVENRELLSYPKKAAVLGHWRTYMIERQIYNRAFRPNTEYSVRMQQTNNFKDQAIFLETEHFSGNIARTLTPMRLPAKSAYKLKAAKNNAESDIQLELDFENKVGEICLPQYVIITYGFNKLSGKITHITYLIPDEKMENILFHEDGMSVPEEVPSYTYEEKEESIVRLKEELKKKIEE